MTQFNLLDSPQGPDPKRLLFAIVLTSAVLMVYSYFFSPTSPLPQKTLSENQEIKAAPETVKALQAQPKESKDAVHEQATGAIPLKISQFSIKDVDQGNGYRRTSYQASISNAGGAITKY